MYPPHRLFDHMLEGFARHGFFDLDLTVEGDLGVDTHHTIEDTGIVLGTAIRQAAGDKKGIRRYGSCILPMDECLMLCAVDLSGRPYLSYESPFTVPCCGQMDTEMVKEFFYAVSYSAAMNLHLKTLTPGNNHHMMEAMFKPSPKPWTWLLPGKSARRTSCPRKEAYNGKNEEKSGGQPVSEKRTGGGRIRRSPADGRNRPGAPGADV